MSRNIFQSLTFKVSLFVIAVMVIALSVFSVVFITSARSKALDEIAKNGQVFANFSNITIYNQYVQYYSHTTAEEFNIFKQNITAILANDTDVIDVGLVGINGIILFDSSELAAGKYNGENRYLDDPVTLKALPLDTTSSRSTTFSGKNVTEIIVPLDQSGGHSFSVRYILSNDSLASRMREVYMQILSVLIPLLIFAIIMGILFAISLIRPIVRLTAAVERIRAGNFGEKAAVASKDEIGRLAASFNDMTDKLKKSYDDIIDEKSRLLSSINGLSFGFILADLDGGVMLSNPQVGKILDRSEALQSVNELIRLFPEFDLGRPYQESRLRNRAVAIPEIAFGSKFVRVFFTPIISPSGPIGTVIVIEDITEPKIIERSKDEFFAVASHELRTPLTAIRTNAEDMLDLYGDKLPNDDMKKIMTDIKAASTRLISIVADFLEVSSLEQGKLKTKKEDFAIADSIEKTMADLAGLAKQKNISMRYDKSPESFLVSADRNHTEQILINLIGNSIKFTVEGGSVDVHAERKDGHIAIHIHDTGIGIDDRNKPLLFRKFQQAGSSILARDTSQGTGLGLYISRLLVTNMGGTIDLEESAVGEGSTFVFTLPSPA